MGIFYVFYLSSNNINNFNQVKDAVIEFMPGISLHIPQMPNKTQIIEDTDDKFNIWCDYFSLSLHNGGQHTEFRSEDYGMNFKFQFWFDIYSVAPNWMEMMLNFIGKIMKNFDGDCVLEANGDTAIVMRKDNIIIADDKKLNGTQQLNTTQEQNKNFNYCPDCKT